MSTYRATIADLQFGVLVDGIELTIGKDGLEGWTDITAFRREDTELLWAPGDHVGKGQRAARYIRMSGNIYLFSPHLAGEIERKFSALLADDELAELMVFDTRIGPQSAWVQLTAGEAVKFAWETPTVGYYQISFKAPDPRKYGPLNIELKSSTT